MPLGQTPIHATNALDLLPCVSVPTQHKSNSEGPFTRCRGLGAAATKAPSTDIFDSHALCKLKPVQNKVSKFEVMKP